MGLSLCKGEAAGGGQMRKLPFWPDVAVAAGWTLYWASTQFTMVTSTPAHVDQSGSIMAAILTTAVVALLSLPMMMSKKWGLILQLVLQVSFLVSTLVMFSQYAVQVGQVISLGVAIYCFLRLTGMIGPVPGIPTKTTSI
jgi:hypothetical protein